MPVSSSPKESLCLGRSVRTLQKEPPPSASSWMTFHWYEAVGNNDHVMFSVGFLTLRNNCIVLSDTFDLWQRIHRGCWDEAGGSAGGWEGPFRCRKGIYFNAQVILVIHLYIQEVYVVSMGKKVEGCEIRKLTESFYPFRQSNRSRRPSSQQREIPKLPCSSPTPWWRLAMVW